MATANSFWPYVVEVKMRPSTRASDAIPSPRPSMRQDKGGPSAGHLASSPVSLERLSRFGPRHWGQLPARCCPSRAAAASIANSLSRLAIYSVPLA